MVEIKTLLEKISQLLDKVGRQTSTFKKLKSSIEDFEPFKNDERIQLVSSKILELSDLIQLKVDDIN